jgi:hypothetical protein
MLAKITPYLHGTSFDPEQVRVMGQAYDKALQALHDRGQPDIVMEVLAKRVIAIVETGLRDPDQICARALEAFGIQDRPK